MNDFRKAHMTELGKEVACGGDIYELLQAGDTIAVLAHPPPPLNATT